MTKINIDQIKKLREKTSASVMECKKALEESEGDFDEAVKFLKSWGMEKAEKKKKRHVTEGIIYAYIHHGGKVGAMVELNCETDFVAKTDEFTKLAHEVAMQVASMNPKDVDTLLKQNYIRDAKITVDDLIKEIISKLGENIVISRFCRFEVGE